MKSTVGWAQFKLRFIDRRAAKWAPTKLQKWSPFKLRFIDPETASGYDGKVATEIISAKLGKESDRWGWNPLRDHIAKTTTRLEFALLALICAGYEKTIQKYSWRSARQVHNAYLAQLVAWGYKAIAVEQVILEKHQAQPEDTQ